MTLVEQDSHQEIFDYFIRNKSNIRNFNLKWIKEQVYGIDPETFPKHVKDVGDIIREIKKKNNSRVCRNEFNMNS